MKYYEQYIEQVVKKFENKEKNSRQELIIHSILGLMSECGEYVEGRIAGNVSNIKEEFGDITYFFWQGVAAIDFDPFEVDLEYSLRDSSDMGINKMFVSACKLAGYYKDFIYYDKEFPNDNLLKLEYARFYFNFKCLLNENNINEVEVMETNGRKLHSRYGNEFSKEAALNRDLEKELEVIDG